MHFVFGISEDLPIVDLNRDLRAVNALSFQAHRHWNRWLSWLDSDIDGDITIDVGGKQ